MPQIGRRISLKCRVARGLLDSLALMLVVSILDHLVSVQCVTLRSPRSMPVQSLSRCPTNQAVYLEGQQAL